MLDDMTLLKVQIQYNTINGIKGKVQPCVFIQNHLLKSFSARMIWSMRHPVSVSLSLLENIVGVETDTQLSFHFFFLLYLPFFICYNWRSSQHFRFLLADLPTNRTSEAEIVPCYLFGACTITEKSQGSMGSLYSWKVFHLTQAPHV